MTETFYTYVIATSSALLIAILGIYINLNVETLNVVGVLKLLEMFRLRKS